jgi:hypothetical protein
MSEKKKKNFDFRFNLRFTDKAVVDLLEDIVNMPDFKLKFGNKNDLLNSALYLGAVELYQESFGKNKKEYDTKSPENDGNILKILRSMRITSDQTAVNVAICEKLLTVLYNLEAHQADGFVVDPELFNSGLLDQLPEHIEAEKQALMKAELLKRKRENK